MIVERYVYYITYIIYLIFLMISLWFLAIYTNVPTWVGWLFVIGIVLLIMGALIKEYVMIDYCYWFSIYIVLNIIGLLALIAGAFFAITYSNITWGVWILFTVGIIFTVVGNMLTALLPDNMAYGIIVSITGFIILILLLFAVFSQGPRSINADLTLNNIFWYFPFLALTFIIGILSVIFEGLTGSIVRCNSCTNSCCCPVPKYICACKCDPCCCVKPEPCCIEEKRIDSCCTEEIKTEPCCTT